MVDAAPTTPVVVQSPPAIIQAADTTAPVLNAAPAGDVVVAAPTPDQTAAISPSTVTATGEGSAAVGSAPVIATNSPIGNTVEAKAVEGATVNQGTLIADNSTNIANATLPTTTITAPVIAPMETTTNVAAPVIASGTTNGGGNVVAEGATQNIIVHCPVNNTAASTDGVVATTAVPGADVTSTAIASNITPTQTGTNSGGGFAALVGNKSPITPNPPVAPKPITAAAVAAAAAIPGETAYLA